MSSSNYSGLLTPPKDEEAYPYRHVWRSIVIEYGLLLLFTVLFFLLINTFGLQIPSRFHDIVNVILSLVPAILWVIFSLWAERFVARPRQHLLKVAIISALVANAIGIPVIGELFQVEKWLPLASALERIVGYTVTIGIVQELLKYLVIRYTVWPNFYRTRLDSLAYGAACAVGYSTILNLHYVSSVSSSSDAVILRVFATVTLHIVTSAIVSYGLSEIYFSHALPFLMPLTVFMGALVTGIATPLRSGLLNASLSLPEQVINPVISTTRPLLSLMFSVAMLIVPLLALSFLYDVLDRREQEVIAGREL